MRVSVMAAGLFAGLTTEQSIHNDLESKFHLADQPMAHRGELARVRIAGLELPIVTPPDQLRRRSTVDVEMTNSIYTDA